MELQQESSNLGALSTSTRFSSSSSAFVSASQSPFFSPRSPQSHVPGPILPNSLNGLLINGFTKQPEPSSTKFVASDVSPAPSFCPSSNFEIPEIANGVFSSSNHSQGRKGKSKRSVRVRSQEKNSFARPSASFSASTSRLRNCDVYIGYHGRKSNLVRFANWLRAELELQGISCFAADRARCRNSRSHDTVQRIMNASSFGLIILTKKSFSNPYTIEELRNFLSKKNLCPIFFDLCAADCLSRDIIERRGELWERNGGELWMNYDGLESEWREAVDGLSRMLDWQLEAYDGNWRDCISNAVVLLATRLGRRGVVERMNRWREKVEKEEFPFHRNENFVGRKKELSELEMILFGDVSGDGEREYFEIKTRHKRKSLSIARAKSVVHSETESSSKGKEPVLWKESEKEIEMQRVGSPQRQYRTLRARHGGNYGRRKRSMKILYGKGIACVSGESGIGKTELVLEFAYRFAQRYKMVLWVGGENRYIRQNYLNLRNFLEVDLNIEQHHSLEKGKVKCFEEQEEEAIAKVRKELMHDIPFLVVIDNLESEKDWWDRKGRCCCYITMYLFLLVIFHVESIIISLVEL